MEVVEHWDSMLEFLDESIEGAIVETLILESVDFELHGDRTLRAQSALMSLIVNCGEYNCVKRTKVMKIKIEKKGQKKNESKKNTKQKRGTCSVAQVLVRIVDDEVLIVFQILGLYFLGWGGVLCCAQFGSN